MSILSTPPPPKWSVNAFKSFICLSQVNKFFSLQDQEESIYKITVDLGVASEEEQSR
jgi:hypothetical protein